MGGLLAVRASTASLPHERDAWNRPRRRTSRPSTVGRMQDAVTVHMDAPPEAVWALISDVTQIPSTLLAQPKTSQNNTGLP